MPLDYIQTSFEGGMNLWDSALKIGETEYGLAYNVRNRTGELQTIQAPVEDSDAPDGLKQGLYAFDVYLLLFNAGAAYYKNIVTDSDWTQVADFAMSLDATRIYAEAVPASSFNFDRKAQANDRIDGSGTETNFNVSPVRIGTTPAGLVCQDGVTQPHVINNAGEARRLQTYESWSRTGTREYVPIGKQMKYVNGILFIVAVDGITIYRSVSGRPLDFVVNVDINGDKGGRADTTSYSVGVSQVTCLSSLNSGELFVGTINSCHPVEFNYDKTIFAEPTFLNRRQFAASVTNQFSFIDILSDYTFIDSDGIRSFNAVAVQQNEGRNSIFSAKISKAFAGIKQGELTTAAIVFDNYSIFAVTTIYGNVLAVYDNNRAVWVCFDNLGITGTIKQFAVANQSSNPTLYAITADKVYKLYSSPAELEAQVYFRALSSGKPSSSIRLEKFWAAFDGGTTEATGTVTEIVNNVEKVSITAPIVDDGEADSTLFNFLNRAKQGWKVQPRLKWSNEAKVPIIQVQAVEVTTPTSLKQKSNLFNGT